MPNRRGILRMVQWLTTKEARTKDHFINRTNLLDLAKFMIDSPERESSLLDYQKS